MRLLKTLAGGLDLGGREFPGQTEHSKTGAVGLLGELPSFEQRFDVVGGAGANRLCLFEQPIGVQFEHKTVVGGHPHLRCGQVCVRAGW